MYLSIHTVIRKVESMFDDIEQKGKQDIDIYECFSLQLVESTDVCNVSMLLLLIRMVFIDGSIRLSRSC